MRAIYSAALRLGDFVGRPGPLALAKLQPHLWCLWKRSKEKRL